MKLWMLIAVAAIASACSKQDMEPAMEDSTTATVEFVAEEVAGRTVFGEPDGTTYPTLWDADHWVALWVNSQKRVKAKPVPSENKKRATISANLVDDESGAYTVYVVSPWGAESGAELNFWNSTKGHKARVPIANKQTPTATSCDPMAQILVAHTPELTGASLKEAFTEQTPLHFTHLTAYGCLTLKNLPEKALKAVVLIAEEPITGYFDFNFNGEEWSYQERDDSQHTLIINTTSAKDVWFGLYPRDFSGKKMIIGAVMADDTYYAKQIEFTTGGNFEAGRIAKFAVNFAGVETNTELSVYKEGGQAVGIRYSTTKDPEDCDHVISLKRSDATPWMLDTGGVAASEATGVTANSADGRKDWATLSTWLSENIDYTMPIYDFCKALGEGWYCPSGTELLEFCRQVYRPNDPQIEVMLAYNGGDLLNGYSSVDEDTTGDRYWTTREISNTPANAYWVRFDPIDNDKSDGTAKDDWNSSGQKKTKKYFGRAVKIVGRESGLVTDLPEAGALMDYEEAAKLGISRPYRPIVVQYATTGNLNWSTANTRLMAYLDGYTRSISTYEEYQAVTNAYGSYTAGTKQAATGRFYVTKINDRYWIIDPEGYPYYMRGICSFAMGDTQQNKTAFANRFSSVSDWTSKSRNELADIGFHQTGAFSTDGYEAQLEYNETNGSTPFPLAPSFGFLGQYKSQKGKTFPNQSANYKIALVLEDSWPAFCVEYMQSKAFDAYLRNKYVFGFFSDNEINFSSAAEDLLLSFLKLDNSVSYNQKAHAAAVAMMTSNGYTGSAAAYQALSSEERKALNNEFCGMLAEKYYKAIRAAKDQVDPGLLYLGSRLHGTPKYTADVVEAAGKYCDIISINYYTRWSPEAKWMQKWAELAPNVPFFVTEFYTQSVEGATSTPPAEHGGAGFYVKTEKDRAYAYQHFTLGLLEAKNCVGWYWFRYQDTDETHSFKGLYDNDYNLFPNLSKMAREVNYNVYNLIEYFDQQTSGN